MVEQSLRKVVATTPASTSGHTHKWAVGEMDPAVTRSRAASSIQLPYLEKTPSRYGLWFIRSYRCEREEAVKRGYALHQRGRHHAKSRATQDTCRRRRRAPSVSPPISIMKNLSTACHFTYRSVIFQAMLPSEVVDMTPLPVVYGLSVVFPNVGRTSRLLKPHAWYVYPLWSRPVYHISNTAYQADSLICPLSSAVTSSFDSRAWISL
ncbi:hypothetical protein BKA58DRAFT_395903 [Alternaria rosae]|uniref:uncharacterized protein n=1 Tax=Alternaria rosae TaxID=1187941 RepID=UPI001E8D32B4|nr:uncharacterized protein BKA58DRAFT_395903 [Alternaria rosae]KAH6881489.1 hypothetical protein BKA58DRAFT_395903 [Alternaria rosae]